VGRCNRRAGAIRTVCEHPRCDRAETLHPPAVLEQNSPGRPPKFVAAIAELTPANPVGEVTYRVLLPSGTVWLKNSGRAFFDGEGRMLRVIGMVADVTDHKQTEEALSGMTRKLVEAQEQERTRIARELHDDISQRLALLAVELGQVQEDRCWTTVASWQAFELTQSSTALPYLTLNPFLAIL
jgi:Histidine kinase